MTDQNDKPDRPDIEPGKAVLLEPGIDIKNLKELPIRDLILYKLDRTIAISGLVAIGLWSLMSSGEKPDFIQVTIAVVGVLGGYIGGRSVSK